MRPKPAQSFRLTEGGDGAPPEYNNFFDIYIKIRIFNWIFISLFSNRGDIYIRMKKLLIKSYPHYLLTSS